MNCWNMLIVIGFSSAEIGLLKIGNCREHVAQEALPVARRQVHRRCEIQRGIWRLAEQCSKLPGQRIAGYAELDSSAVRGR